MRGAGALCFRPAAAVGCHLWWVYVGLRVAESRGPRCEHLPAGHGQEHRLGRGGAGPDRAPREGDECGCARVCTDGGKVPAGRLSASVSAGAGRAGILLLGCVSTYGGKWGTGCEHRGRRAGPCRVLNKRCALGQGYLFPVAEGSGLRWCWGAQQKSGLVGHEKGEGCVCGHRASGQCEGVWPSPPGCVSMTE